MDQIWWKHRDFQKARKVSSSICYYDSVATQSILIHRFATITGEHFYFVISIFVGIPKDTKPNETVRMDVFAATASQPIFNTGYRQNASGSVSLNLIGDTPIVIFFTANFNNTSMVNLEIKAPLELIFSWNHQFLWQLFNVSIDQN